MTQAPSEQSEHDASQDDSVDTLDVQPWETLEKLIDLDAHDRLRAFADLLPPGEVPYTIAHLDDAHRVRLFTMLSRRDPEYAAHLMEHFEDEAAADIIEVLPPEQAAAIVGEMDSDDQTDVLYEINDAGAEAILDQMDPQEAEEARERLQYEPETAGGLMITEVLRYRPDQDVDQVIFDLRRLMEDENDYESRYIYVVDEHEQLLGVITMRTLLLARKGLRLNDLMLTDPVTVKVDTSLDALEDMFDRYNFHALPVVGGDGVLQGVVKHVAVEEALGERTEEDLLKISGIIGGEELRSMPVFARMLGRLAFLLPVMLMGLVSATVIAFFEGTVQDLPIVAAFLPIVAGLSGSSGTQAVGVSIRELAMGLIKPNDYFRVLSKEIRVGILNGLVLGTILYGVVFLWQGDPWLALIVGAAFPFTSALATSLGGTMPVLLHWLGLDAATASGPLTTTMTDLCSFFIVLIFATTMLSYVPH